MITSLWRRPSPAAQQPDEFDVAFRDRMRQAASCLVLSAITFLTQPTRIISDTKIDMPIDPVGFLGRALHMWDPSQFGQIQNQAYGYLFPMGPFYALGGAIGLPSWIVQRLWLSLVLCVAFLGVVRLARALRIGTPATRLVAGFAFALAPHAQTLVGVNSSEFWPTAVLPWIVLPLVRGAQQGYSPRRAAALSGLATFCCGGINATAEAAILLVPVLYLLSRARGPRRRRLIGWWVCFTAMATFWWVVPLLLMAAFGFPFMPYTESAVATTGTTSLTNILRGMQDWVAFIPVEGHPWWPAGFDQATVPWLIAATAVLAGLGITGLVLRRLPERTFLLITLLVGTAIIASGHVSDVSNPFAPQIRSLLDGPLAAIRNLHKFDVAVRLPVCFGIAHLLTKPFHVPKLPRLRPAFAVGVTTVLVLTMVPLATAGLGARGSFDEFPGYWKQATTWLNQHTGHKTVLAVPGARWGEYTWGRPLDEPMQPELNVRWAAREIVPWGSDGLARLFEGIDDRLTSGRGSAGLTEVLRRVGVKYLLVRNDLERDTLRGAWPPRVHQALESSAGLQRVKYFGGLIGSSGTGDATTWYDQPYPALEVYRVPDAAPVSETVSASKPLRVTGGPESLLALADAGLLQGDRPVIFNNDPGASDIDMSDTAVTDSLRRREVKFSDMRHAASPTLTKNEKYQGAGPARDITEPGWKPYTSTATYDGISSVTASSAASDITAPAGGRSSGLLPYAAFDGDTRTTWQSAGWHGPVGQWIKVRFDDPIPVRAISASFVQNLTIGPPVSAVEISTNKGTIRHKVAQSPKSQLLSTRPGTTDWLKIKITDVAWQPKSKVGTRVGISEIKVPGLVTARSIATPPVHDPGPGKSNPTVALSGDRDSTPGCMLGSHTWTCSGALQTYGEDGSGFDRTFSQRHRQNRFVRGSAVLTDPGLVRQLTTLPKVYPKVRASSTMLQQPQLLGRSALDGDPRTMWIPNAWDPKPSLTITFRHKVRINRIQLTAGAGSNGPPVQVSMIADGQIRGGWAGADGWIAFPSVTAKKITLQFTQHASSQLQISDVHIPGVKPLGGPPPFQLKSVCGLGPTLSVDGYPIRTRITGGTMADLLAGRPVHYRTCKRVTVTPGRNRIKVAPSDPYRIRSAVLGRKHPKLLPANQANAEPVPVASWGPQRRQVHVATDGPSYLIVNENFNKGWKATMNGRTLSPVRLDGWRQAWRIPDQTYASVTLTFEPDTPYRLALLAGLGLVLLLMAAVAAPVRRGASAAALSSSAPGHIGRRAVWLGTAALGLWTAGIYGVIMIMVVLLLIGRARRLLERGGLVPAVRYFSRGLTSVWLPATLLSAAGLCLAVGTQLQVNEHFDLSGPMRDVAAQMLCLPVLGALAAVLSRFAVPPHGEPLDTDAPMVARPPVPAAEPPPPVAGPGDRPDTPVEAPPSPPEPHPDAEPHPVVAEREPGQQAEQEGAQKGEQGSEPGPVTAERAEPAGPRWRSLLHAVRRGRNPRPEPPAAVPNESGPTDTGPNDTAEPIAPEPDMLEPDAAAVLGLSEEDLAILAESENETPTRAPRRAAGQPPAREPGHRWWRRRKKPRTPTTDAGSPDAVRPEPVRPEPGSKAEAVQPVEAEPMESEPVENESAAPEPAGSQAGEPSAEPATTPARPADELTAAPNGTSDDLLVASRSDGGREPAPNGSTTGPLPPVTDEPDAPDPSPGSIPADTDPSFADRHP